MEKLISSKRFLTDPIARNLLESLEQGQEELRLANAVFYYDFPSFRDYEDDAYKASVLLLSPHHGIIASKVCDAQEAKRTNGNSIRSTDDNLTQFFSILFGRLIKSRILRRSKTELILPFAAVIFVPGLEQALGNGLKPALENPISSSYEELKGWLGKNRTDAIPKEVLAEARSIIEGAKALARPKLREIPTDRKAIKAKILATVEAEIANFDSEQRKAAITMLYGPERIRGLAGTGKTIVLAMKAAQLHLDDPSKRILYTFYTKSLYDLIRLLITRFYRHYKDSDPNWEKVKVLHAWGGSSVPGVYHTACMDNSVAPLRWGQEISKTIEHPFNYVCGDLLAKAQIKPAYDYLLIDEGQDLPEKFFQLCFRLATGERDNKNIVWAYDELQNIFDVKVRSPRELFGTDEKGEPLIDLERASANLPKYASNDVILYKSYRNPKEVLLTAHALGFGLYSKQIVQMLENKEHWEDVGYQVLKGDFTKGANTVIFRPDGNSPLSISKYEKTANIIQWHVAENTAKETHWIIAEIRSFLNDGLRPEDILVISLDDRNARTYFELIQKAMLSHDVACNNILDNPFTSSRFAVEGKITLSTVHRAKGNEAAAIIAIGIDALYPLRNTRTGRNRIFTAFTRAKAWVRVSGIGEEAEFFIKEISLALQKCPNLEFPFPDLKQVELLQRDLSLKEVKIKRLRDKYRRELSKLGLEEHEMADFLAGEEKK